MPELPFRNWWWENILGLLQSPCGVFVVALWYPCILRVNSTQEKKAPLRERTTHRLREQSPILVSFFESGTN